jgi:hypothetical protein
MAGSGPLARKIALNSLSYRAVLRGWAFRPKTSLTSVGLRPSCSMSSREAYARTTFQDNSLITRLSSSENKAHLLILCCRRVI